MLKLKLNGELKTLEHPCPLDQALETWGFHRKARVAIAINGTFVPRSAYRATTVGADDDVEILSPMQGG